MSVPKTTPWSGKTAVSVELLNTGPRRPQVLRCLQAMRLSLHATHAQENICITFDSVYKLFLSRGNRAVMHYLLFIIVLVIPHYSSTFCSY